MSMGLSAKATKEIEGIHDFDHEEMCRVCGRDRHIVEDYWRRGLADLVPCTSSARADVFRAMEFAERAHLGQKRDSGQDFYQAHCLVVYHLLKMRRGDAESLCVALLHDTVEDTDTTLKEIEALFGYVVMAMVHMLTKTEKNVFPLLKFDNGVYANWIVDKAMVIKHSDTCANTSEMYTWTAKQRREYHESKTCWRTE